MWVVRPIALSDLSAFVSLAVALGPGMTTLPADREALVSKIERSVASFAGRELEAREYVLVLEDTDTGAILGTAAVYPDIGQPHGFFSFRITPVVHHSREFGISYTPRVLHLANDYTGATEVGSLAVRPGLRGGGAGRLLAQSRYMLLACFPSLFAGRVMAEMRGWQDAAGRSPFWEAVGKNFFKMDFDRADKLSAVHGAEFIADLLPRYPLYVDLLPADARDTLGRPHEASRPALKMLRSEGFMFDGLVDVFDAGPQVHAERASIRTVASSAHVQGVELRNAVKPNTPTLVAVKDLSSFRVARLDHSERCGSAFENLWRALGASAASELCAAPTTGPVVVSSASPDAPAFASRNENELSEA